MIWTDLACTALLQGVTSTDIRFYLAFVLAGHTGLAVAFPVGGRGAASSTML